MTREFQSTLEAFAIELTALRHYILCMAHVKRLAYGEFMSSLRVKGRTKASEAHELDQQFGENGSIDIGKSQRLSKEGNTRINKVSAMKPGLSKINQKMHISSCCGSPEIHIQIAEITCCID